MPGCAVDDAASDFKYKTPTPIQGAPTNKTLNRLKQELPVQTPVVSNQTWEVAIMGILDWSYWTRNIHRCCQRNL